MYNPESLEPFISVFGTETQPSLLIAWLSNLQYYSNVNFEDGKHVYQKLRESALASMTSEDIAQFHYYLGQHEETNRRKAEFSMKNSTRLKKK